MIALCSVTLLFHLLGGGGVFASAHKLESTKPSNDAFTIGPYDKGKANFRWTIILMLFLLQRL